MPQRREKPSATLSLTDVDLAPEPRIVLSTRGKGLSEEPVETPIEWPASWRLPQQGEAIRLSPTFTGIVHTLDFDIARNLIVIHIR